MCYRRALRGRRARSVTAEEKGDATSRCDEDPHDARRKPAAKDRVGQARRDGRRRAPGLARALEAQPTRQAIGRDRRARSSRSTTLAGVKGVSVTRAPKGASASSTALAIAAGGEI